ncbi:MAG TPA: CSLREA domain-containing protein [Thermoanaerobaculia bacterium]|jgi:CSLREA domain-containing protein|nr:CSLREA domain-containing protein [Thermoanaerobaculia bacterium]
MNGSLRRPLFAALALSALAVSAAGAAVYTPTKTADSADGACDADCSLREAIVAANADPAEDVILLHAGVYTLTLAGNETLGNAGDLNVRGDLVLIGDGVSRTVIDGGGIDRIFFVAGGSTMEIRDVTLRNGRSQGAGGAIRNEGVLTISRSVLDANASVAGTGGAGFGGAILTDGDGSTLTVTDSTISNNTAQGGGGGIAIGGRVTLENVTLSGNRSLADFGGGLYVFSDARTSLNNVTIVNNTAAMQGGGIFAENAAFIGFAPRVTNSIIAANTAPIGPDCSGSLDSSYDLIGNGTACNGPSAAKHDLVGTQAAPINPLLGALANNGGATPTHALSSGSPALNAGSPAASGNDACEATDQRGAARPAPAGGRCDIGAFEATATCVAGGNALCLNNGRFKVTATWQTRTSGGVAQALPLTTDSGLFTFFDPNNVELTVKVLNACGLRVPRYWVHISGLTNLRVDVTVMDTKTGLTKTYTNPQGRPFLLIQDNSFFNVCP